MLEQIKNLLGCKRHVTDKSIKKVAVIIDGGRLREECRLHRIKITPEKVVDFGVKVLNQNEELFRIYYYDSPPYNDHLNGPVSRLTYKSKTTDLDDLRKLYSDIAHQDLIAFRHGTLHFHGWALRNWVLANVIKGKGLPAPLLDEHFKPVFKQKGVDMKIGLDIAWLAIKKIVDRIILISADSDFVAAMKLARVEGVQVVLVPLSGKIMPEMREHSDEVRAIDICTI